MLAAHAACARAAPRSAGLLQRAAVRMQGALSMLPAEPAGPCPPCLQSLLRELRRRGGMSAGEREFALALQGWLERAGGAAGHLGSSPRSARSVPSPLACRWSMQTLRSWRMP